MKTLLIMRHAKSDWSSGTRVDKERPLNARGRLVAPRMAEWVMSMRLLPQVALVSSATRTFETWALMKPKFPSETVSMELRPDFYHATADVLLGAAQVLPTTVDHAMFVAHMPGVEDFAEWLADPSQTHVIDPNFIRFPTATICALTFDCHDWADVVPGKGRITAFKTPKTLA